MLFARLAATDLEPDELERWHRRLIAVTNATKRDLDRAEGQLERFAADLARLEDHRPGGVAAGWCFPRSTMTG